MKTIHITFFLFSITVSVFAQETYQSYAAKASEAYKAGDHPKFYAMILAAHKLHPYHQGILYQLGAASALTGKPDDAIAYLNKAIQINATFDLNDADFTSLSNRPDFEKLKSLQRELQQKVVTSDTAFVLPDKTLHIESIAAGEKDGVFYFGSIHKRKIIRRDEKGQITDFTAPAQDGLASVFGVKVDAARKVLWACSSPLEEMEHFDTTTKSAVYKYDINTRKLLTKFSSETPGGNIFGDLALDPTGKAYISDSRSNTVFYANENTGKLEPYFTSGEFWNLQGITFSDDGKFLFIADYIKGLFRLDTQTKSLITITNTLPVSLKAIDGLIYYKGSLVAIQNSVVPMRVTQYKLNAAQGAIEAFTIIDRAHPAFNEPTIGCITNNAFYYVANSLWSGYTEQHELKSESELQSVVILKSKLE